MTDAKSHFLQIAFSYTALNPHLNLTLSVDGKQELCADMCEPGWGKWRPFDPTSPHWYDTARLKRLIAAYIANGKGGRPVREFLAEFAGLSGSAKQKSVLDTTGMARASLDSLVPFDDKTINDLLQAMVSTSKPIKPEALGIIGRDHWWVTAFCLDGNGDSFAYRKQTGCSGGIPWVVEAAFCALPETESRLIVRGINFTPSLRDPFQQLVGTNHFYSTSLDFDLG